MAAGTSYQPLKGLTNKEAQEVTAEWNRGLAAPPSDPEILEPGTSRSVSPEQAQKLPPNIKKLLGIT